MRHLLQPIAAFVCCNRPVSPAGATTRLAAGERLNGSVNSAHDDANTLDRQLNPANGRSAAKIVLFHFVVEPRVK